MIDLTNFPKPLGYARVSKVWASGFIKPTVHFCSFYVCNNYKYIDFSMSKCIKILSINHEIAYLPHVVRKTISEA